VCPKLHSHIVLKYFSNFSFLLFCVEYVLRCKRSMSSFALINNWLIDWFLFIMTIKVVSFWNTRYKILTYSLTWNYKYCGVISSNIIMLLRTCWSPATSQSVNRFEIVCQKTGPQTGMKCSLRLNQVLISTSPVRVYMQRTSVDTAGQLCWPPSSVYDGLVDSIRWFAMTYCDNSINTLHTGVWRKLSANR